MNLNPFCGNWEFNLNMEIWGTGEEVLLPCVEGTLWGQRMDEGEKQPQSILGMGDKAHTELGPLRPSILVVL